MVAVRPERDEDRAAVRAVNEGAFGRPDEADLVDALRAAGRASLSLVAAEAGRVVGHILFSPVTIEPVGGGDPVPALGLAPMAVRPELQRKGIGSRLVRAGLEGCRFLGHERMLVLGHPEFYPRFGFVPASRFGLSCAWDVPNDVFMALELRPEALSGLAGHVRYAPEFDDL